MAATKYFKNAVKNNDVCNVQIMMKDSLLRDRSFREFAEMEKIASSMPGLYVPYDGEELKQSPSEWNKDYMNLMLTKLLFNFSHERVEHLKKIIRHLYPNDSSDSPNQYSKTSENIIDRIKYIQNTESAIRNKIDKTIKLLEDEHSDMPDDGYIEPRVIKLAIDASNKLAKTLMQMDKYIDDTFGKYKDYADYDRTNNTKG